MTRFCYAIKKAGGWPTFPTLQSRVADPFALLFFAKDSLFAVKLYFLSGEVQENLSLLGCWSQFKLGEQAGAVIVGAPAEHAEDGVQHLAGDGHQGLQFGFVACDQSLIKGAQVGIVAYRDQSGHVQGATQVAIAGAADA